MRAMAQSRREIARYVPSKPKKSEPVVLDRVLLLPEQREAIERKYGFKLWSGVTKHDDELLRHRRTAFYSLNTPVAADKPLLAKAFWRSVTTDQDVVANLAKEPSPLPTATCIRLREVWRTKPDAEGHRDISTGYVMGAPTFVAWVAQQSAPRYRLRPTCIRLSRFVLSHSAMLSSWLT